MRFRTVPLAVSIASVAVVIVMSACATLGPKVQGQTDLVAWEATDLALEQREVRGSKRWYYSFALVVRETRGVAVTFNEVETTIYQPGTTSWTGRYRGVWKLDPQDAFRIPLQSSLSCHPGSACSGPNVPVPLWRVTLRGTEEQGRSVSTVIDLSLPADPPSPPPTSSRSVREITLDPKR